MGAGFWFLCPLALVLFGLFLTVRECNSDRFPFYAFSIIGLWIAVLLVLISFKENSQFYPEIKNLDGNIVVIEDGNLITMHSTSHVIIMVDGKILYKNIPIEGEIK